MAFCYINIFATNEQIAGMTEFETGGHLATMEASVLLTPCGEVRSAGPLLLAGGAHR